MSDPSAPRNHALWQVCLGRALVRQGMGEAASSVEDFRQAARLAPVAARGELEAVLART